VTLVIIGSVFFGVGVGFLLGVVLATLTCLNLAESAGE
jgi:hypothetical protein